ANESKNGAFRLGFVRVRRLVTSRRDGVPWTWISGFEFGSITNPTRYGSRFCAHVSIARH
ncbi:unnamed protein product, partial [Musa textilis]